MSSHENITGSLIITRSIKETWPRRFILLEGEGSVNRLSWGVGTKDLHSLYDHRAFWFSGEYI